MLSKKPQSIKILKCRERDSGSLADDCQPFSVVGSYGILEPEQAEWLEGTRDAKCVCRRVTPMAVNGDIDVGTDRIADCLYQLDHIPEFTSTD